MAKKDNSHLTKPNIEGWNCQGLLFDIKVVLDGNAKYYILMLNTKEKHKFVHYVPKNNQWVTVMCDFSDAGINPKDLESIQIGLSTKNQTHATWFVRNIRIVEK